MAAIRAPKKRKREPKPCRRCGCPAARAQYTAADVRRGHWLCRSCRAATARERYLQMPKKLNEHEAEMLAVRTRFVIEGIQMGAY